MSLTLPKFASFEAKKELKILDNVCFAEFFRHKFVEIFHSQAQNNFGEICGGGGDKIALIQDKAKDCSLQKSGISTSWRFD